MRQMVLMQTSPHTTRVGCLYHNPSGRRCRRGHFRSVFTPSSCRYTYQTVPGRSGWPSRDPIGELEGANLLYAIAGNNLVNGIDVLGLVDFEFVVIKNETGKNGGNNSGEWGSPGSYFTGSESGVTHKSATTTVTGKGPNSSYCCNTVISKKEPSNGNAGSIIVYIKDADPGTYSVQLSTSGNASITLGLVEDKEGHNAGAVLGFYIMEKLVLHGFVDIGRSGNGKMSWSDSKDTPMFVTIKSKSDRIQIGKYDLKMNLNNCGKVTVTATGTVGIGDYKRVK